MDHADKLRSILVSDPGRRRVLALVESLGLPDCWVGAGFVRNAVWDHLHYSANTTPSGDIDVLWFSAERGDAAGDRDIEAQLRAREPALAWSVKNQARMHTRNLDPPYRGTTDAMRHWPETATAVAARRECDKILLTAPFGLDDLFDRVVRPTARFQGEKYRIYLDRIRHKRWQERWPKLRIVGL
jgi:hypothetical protein